MSQLCIRECPRSSLFFPGLVLQVKNNGIKVSVMIKAGENNWKWPSNADVDVYQVEDVIAIIKDPVKSNKTDFKVPEVNVYWN